MARAVFISCNNNDDLYNESVRQNSHVINNKNIKIVEFDQNSENRYISVRYNEFLNSWNYDDNAWFVFCHNDWEIREDIILKLKFLDTNTIYGPIGAIVREQVSPHRMIYEFVGSCDEQSRDKSCARSLICRHRETGTPVDTLDAQCMIVHSSLIKKYNLRFDDRFDFHLYVEDFSLSAKINFGVETKIIELKCCHHNIINSLIGKMYDEYQKNLRKWNEKYNCKTHLFWLAHRNLNEYERVPGFTILPRIVTSRGGIYKRDPEEIIKSPNDANFIGYSFISENSRVLDVGCACGDFGSALHDYKSCRVIGFEYSEESLQIARETGKYESLYQVDLDRFDPSEFSWMFQSFDFIFIGDVLEHIRQPMEALVHLRKFLKPDGAFVLSIPNIAHASTKSALLCDHFDYTDYGLMDRTHIHFFTWKSIAEILADANLLIEKFVPTFFGIKHLLNFNPFYFFNSITRHVILKNHHSFVGQYVVLCRAYNGFDIEQRNLESLDFSPRKYKKEICNAIEGGRSPFMRYVDFMKREILIVRFKFLKNTRKKPK